MFATDTKWPAELNIFMLCLLIEKVCQLLYYLINIVREGIYIPDITKYSGQEWVALKQDCLMGNYYKREGFRRLATMRGVENYLTGRKPLHQV